MFGTAVIVFREVLEAAIIIGIVAAATRATALVGGWLIIIGSAFCCSFYRAYCFDSQVALGQELFNAVSVLGVAVLMLAWHKHRMAKHGAELLCKDRNVPPVYEKVKVSVPLLIVVGLAVLREGQKLYYFYMAFPHQMALEQMRCY